MNKSLEVSEHEPDELDKTCNAIFGVLEGNGDSDEKIDILEQCIDYLLLDIAEGCNE